MADLTASAPGALDRLKAMRGPDGQGTRPTGRRSDYQRRLSRDFSGTAALAGKASALLSPVAPPVTRSAPIRHRGGKLAVKQTPNGKGQSGPGDKDDEEHHDDKDDAVAGAAGRRSPLLRRGGGHCRPRR